MDIYINIDVVLTFYSRTTQLQGCQDPTSCMRMREAGESREGTDRLLTEFMAGLMSLNGFSEFE